MPKIGRLKKVVLPLAFLLFLGGIMVALRKHPGGLRELEYAPLALIILILSPLTYTFLAYELKTAGVVLGKTLKLSNTFKAVILSSAMNIFPIPGGYLVRYAYLRTEGVRRRDAVMMLVIQNMLWVAAALIIFSGMCVFYRPGVIAEGIAMGGVGVSVIAAVSVVLYKLHNNVKSGIQLVVIRLFLVSIDCLRIYLCFVAMNSGVELFEAVVVGLSKVISGVVFFIPGGLGISEVVSEFLGGMLGIPPGVSYLASSLDRIAVWVFLAVAVTIILFADRIRPFGRK